MFCSSVFLVKKVKIHHFQNVLVTKYLRQINQTNLPNRNFLSIFVFRRYVFRLIKNPVIKIKKHLMLTSFASVMYKIAEKYLCLVQYLHYFTSNLANLLTQLIYSRTKLTSERYSTLSRGTEHASSFLNLILPDAY